MRPRTHATATLSLSLCLLAFCAGTALAGPPIIREVQCGIYTSTTVSKEARADFGNHVTHKDTRFLEVTTRIPARVNVDFGCQVEISGDEKAYELVHRTTFPARLTDKRTGGSADRLETRQSYAPGIKTFGGSMDDENDLVPGPWTLELVHKGKTLFKKTFTMDKP